MVFGGLLALAGALTCAELSASLPYAGGDYIYIREAYGRLMGFLSGWSSFLVTFSGAIAFLAVILNGFVSFFIPALGSQDVIFSIPLPFIPITATVGMLFPWRWCCFCPGSTVWASGRELSRKIF